MPSEGDLVQARIVGTFGGQPIVNTLGFKVQSAVDTFADLAAELRDELDAALGLLTGDTGLWSAQRTDAYVLNALEVVDILPGTSALQSFALAATGAVTGEGMAPNDAVCITWRSETKGAGARGRSYMTGMLRAAQFNGQWTEDATGAISDIGQAMLDNFGPSAGPGIFLFSVIHKVAGGAPLVPPVSFPIVSFTVHTEVRSIGRRAVGRRIHRSTPTP